MQKYFDFIQNQTGASVGNASVLVKQYPSGTTATIYSDDGLTQQPNPVVTNSKGYFEFYAADGLYTLDVSGSLIGSTTLGPVRLEKDAVDTSLTGFWVSPETYGAKGDNSTSDTVAFQLAINALDAAGGGTLILSPKTYYLSDAVFLKNNLTIEGNGATLIKKSISDPTYVFFVSLSYGATGYGSGVNNVTVRGLTFRGTFSSPTGRAGCAFALHHAKDILIEDCQFIEMQANGHTLDVGGCDGVTIKNCEFYGFQVTSTTTQSSECIQLDQSKNGSLSYADTAGSYDGLPTKNLTIESCKFLPLTVGGVTYPAPNPLGNHTVREGYFYENITFRNNLIVDPFEDTLSLPSASRYRGTVHLSGCKNVIIENNRWLSTTAKSVRCISVYGVVIGNPVGADPNVVSSVTTIPGVSPINVRISGNTFNGFSGEVEENSLIYVEGVSTASVEQLTIVDNTFRDNGVTTTTSYNMYLNYVKDAGISRNKTVNARRLMRLDNSTSVRVDGNHLRGVKEYPIYAESCTDLSIEGNHVNDYGLSFNLRSTTNLRVRGNTFLAPKTENSGSSSQAMLIVSCSRFNITDNIIYSSSTRTRGIAISGTSNNGLVRNNIISGYTTQAQDSTSPAATQLVISDNLT
jgi:hypothetical protein